MNRAEQDIGRLAGGLADLLPEVIAMAVRESETRVVIRQALDAGDVELVRGLMREYGAYLAANPTGKANICIAGYEAELAGLPRPYQALLLAQVDGQAAGCIAVKSLSLAAEGCAQELKRLWVGAGFRGLRLGRKLMEAAVAYAREAGATAVYLDTVPAAMPEANRIYEAMGFERVDRYNDNGVEGVVFFRLGFGK